MTATFNDLGIIEQITRALAKNNYTYPTPIQHLAGLEWDKYNYFWQEHE